MTALISRLLARVFVVGVASSVLATSSFAQGAAPSVNAAPAGTVPAEPAPVLQAPVVPVEKTVSVAPESVPESAAGKRYFFSGHLELGLGLATYSLRGTQPGERFLGSIDELKEESGMPVRPSLGWSFCRFAALQLDYEEYRGRTYTDTENNHSDGIVVLKGPVAYLVGRAPLDAFMDDPPRWASRVIPLGGVGYTFMDASMDTASWWGLGYDSPEQYQALGSPSDRNNGYYRSFKLDDAYTVTYMLGVSAKVTDRIAVDVTWTRADVDIDAAFYLRDNLGGKGTIPFHYDSFTAGLKYLF